MTCTTIGRCRLRLLLPCSLITQQEKSWSRQYLPKSKKIMTMMQVDTCDTQSTKHKISCERNPTNAKTSHHIVPTPSPSPRHEAPTPPFLLFFSSPVLPLPLSRRHDAVVLLDDHAREVLVRRVREAPGVLCLRRPRCPDGDWGAREGRSRGRFRCRLAVGVLESCSSSCCYRRVIVFVCFCYCFCFRLIICSGYFFFFCFHSKRKRRFPFFFSTRMI